MTDIKIISEDKKYIEDKYIEIRTDLRTFEVKIIHNYTTNAYLIQTLENAINAIKNLNSDEIHN